MAIPVSPFVVERLAKPGVTPKTVRLDRGHIYVTYEEQVPDREPVTWAGVDMNVGNNTYAFPDGTTTVERNDYSRQYNRACTKILRVRRRGDNRVMAKYQNKAWDTYKNRVRDHTRKEARRYVDAGVAVGYEELSIHRLTVRGNGMAPFPRGRQKTVLNTGQRRRAHRNAAGSAGLPSAGVDPHGTSAKCFMCGGKMKRSTSWTKPEHRPAKARPQERGRVRRAAVGRRGPARHVGKVFHVRREDEALHIVDQKRAQHVVPAMPRRTRAGLQRGGQHHVPYHIWPGCGGYRVGGSGRT